MIGGESSLDLHVLARQLLICRHSLKELPIQIAYWEKELLNRWGPITQDVEIRFSHDMAITVHKSGDIEVEIRWNK